jgi:hypothetical protein
MARPQLDDEVLARLEKIVDGRTKVPASHLTTTQRIAFVLDELEEADGRLEYLEARVDTLEKELEEERSDPDPDPADQAINNFDGLGSTSNRRQF